MASPWTKNGRTDSRGMFVALRKSRCCPSFSARGRMDNATSHSDTQTDRKKNFLKGQKLRRILRYLRKERLMNSLQTPLFQVTNWWSKASLRKRTLPPLVKFVCGIWLDCVDLCLVKLSREEERGGRFSLSPRKTPLMAKHREWFHRCDSHDYEALPPEFSAHHPPLIAVVIRGSVLTLISLLEGDQNFKTYWFMWSWWIFLLIHGIYVTYIPFLVILD